MIEEKQVVDEKTVCYVSNFDLQSKSWIEEFQQLDSLRQGLVDTLGNS